MVEMLFTSHFLCMKVYGYFNFDYTAVYLYFLPWFQNNKEVIYFHCRWFDCGIKKTPLTSKNVIQLMLYAKYFNCNLPFWQIHDCMWHLNSVFIAELLLRLRPTKIIVVFRFTWNFKVGYMYISSDIFLSFHIFHGVSGKGLMGNSQFSCCYRV